MGTEPPVDPRLADTLALLARVSRGVRAFKAEMQALGIHVGLGISGGTSFCACCGQRWPCPAVTGGTDGDT